jgi:hypothetical protein
VDLNPEQGTSLEGEVLAYARSFSCIIIDSESGKVRRLNEKEEKRSLSVFKSVFKTN